MAKRRQVLAALLSAIAAPVARSLPEVLRLAIDPPVLRLAFGSCVSQRKPQSIWARIAAHAPQAFLMMGDGIYPEHEDRELPVVEAIEAAYRAAAAGVELARFRERVPVIAIWDDNDYGGSDIGKSFAHKRRSKELFLDFWTKAAEREVRDRADGIYGVWEFGSEARRTQIIVPDLRYCRSEWAQTEADYRDALRASGLGPYRAATGADLRMLGEAQWRWLETCLCRPARLRLIVSSIQCLPEGRGWESWSNFPQEKARLLRLIRNTEASGVVILSGDTHYAEVSRVDDSVVGYPLWEFTSSGLTESWPAPGPNPRRQGAANPVPNFGLLHVNWLADDPLIIVEFRDDQGRRLLQQSLLLGALRG